MATPPSTAHEQDPSMFTPLASGPTSAAPSIYQGSPVPVGLPAALGPRGERTALLDAPSASAPLYNVMDTGGLICMEVI